MAAPDRSRPPWWQRPGVWLVGAVLLALVFCIAWLAADEARSSRWQAAWLSERVPELTYQIGPGPSPSIRFPGPGPFDARRGYDQLPQRVKRLESQGFSVTEQARMSPAMVEFIDRGLFATYPESAQAGLALRDCRGEVLTASRYPERVYGSFESVPALLVSALLFIENRELLDERYPMHNPAVEWDRFGKALFDQALRRLYAPHNASGGSTLATQIEKYRHSTGGRTDTPTEKLRQMASASLRAYLDGENTLPRRRQIVTDYLNSVPLAARAGFGEVNGIGDGMWAWYGRDLPELTRLLPPPTDETAAPDPRRALVFKEALSLMVAQRRPAHYLADGLADLRRLTDSHLRLMADAGVITPALRDAALPLSLTLRPQFAVERPASFVDRKAVNAVRRELRQLLGMPHAYDVDRLDLDVDSALNGPVQRAATELLRGLADPAAARAAGLVGQGLLQPGDDPSKISFSFTLYERGVQANLLRVQTDSLDQPFDLNQGARLDLGSTAKLRTLVTYLELVADLHRRWGGLSPAQLAVLPIGRRDALGRWAREHLLQPGAGSLAAMLAAAMQRHYSANPNEGFFTGGGLHRFVNFAAADNGRTMSVADALTHSVNLVFVRLMRDVVAHVMAGREGENAELFDDPANPRRQLYLARFADKEGQVFTARFHRQYAGKSTEEAEALLVRSMRPTPSRLAAAFYLLEPEAGLDRLGAFITRHLPAADVSPAALQALHEQMGPGRWPLADQGYLAGLHPLALWVAAHLRAHPGATLGETIAAGAEQRQETYRWLFRTQHQSAQNRRIRELLEVEAFDQILAAWQRLGYPFDRLTPSYATALGASGDRPAALAELMGIIVNSGRRLPVERVSALQFAAGTPYETRLAHRPSPGEQVLPAEVAETLRRALRTVVDDGTARRLDGALVLRDGTVVDIGGKTGTGDHRYDTYGRGGALVSSRVVNRSATLVFYIGERFFGTMMAYVHEPHAANYSFTSALPVQLLKTLAPVLLPLVEGGACSSPLEPAIPRSQ